MHTILTSLAHPGHGITEPSSFRHYLTEPLHVVALAALVAVAFELVMWRRAKRRA
ncbi:MAG TPA: hypothetical protein VGC41_29180 [Kofleriaceae bacterium]